MNSGLSTRGCLLGATPGQAEGLCEMEKDLGTAAPPGLLVCVHTRLADSKSWLSSEEKREEIHPWKKNAAYFRARLAFSPFKCSRRVLPARTVFGTRKTRSLTCSSAVFACSHCSKQSCHKSNDLRLPKEPAICDTF